MLVIEHNSGSALNAPKHRPRRQPVPRIKRRAPLGTSPGKLVPDPAAQASSLHYLRFDAEGFDEQSDCAVDQLPAPPRHDHEVVWLNLIGLSDIALIQAIGLRFGLHDLALEDVVNVHQRPKIDEYEDYLYVVARMAPSDGSVEFEQVSIFLTQGVVLTFQQRAGDCFEPVRERIRNGKGRIRRMGADYLLYALLDALIDGYFPLLEAGGESLERLEDGIVAKPAPAHIERVHNLKRELLALRRAVWPTRDMLSALLRDELRFVSDATRVYLRDVHDHSVQLVDLLETYREIASGLVDAYLSSQSTRLNEVMKVLTVMSTIFLPLTFITGLYGMNFDRSSPWNMPELGWRLGYPFALLAMVMAAISLGYFFWRKGWLRK